MCPGLHRIELPESPTPTYVLLHPREARSVSFDAFTRGFGVDRKAAEAEAVAESANGTLFDYNAWVANSRMQNPAGQTSRDALDACAKWLEQARQVIVKGVPVKAFEVATSARAALVGTPVSSFAELTDYVGFHVFDLQSKGLLTEARTLLDVGLLMLPDAPTLLAIQGEMLLQNGDSAGLDLLERALEREAWMPDAMRDRARNLLPASA